MLTESQVISKKPDFFVVGAPKSGTTSLYFYLKSHPQIFLPRRKELLFFCDDLHFTYPILNEQQFLDYYKEVKDQTAIGEVSVWNLYSGSAAKNIFHFKADSKIIIMLRNPVDMMYALHSNHLFNDNETIASFEEALRAEDSRKAGNQISPVIKCPVEGLLYSEVAAYSKQVERYFEVFGKEKVKIILFNDFIARTPEIYREILRFLEVDDTILPEFKIHNASKTTKNEAIKQLTIDPPAWLKSAGRILFPHQSKQRDWLMKWLWKINTRQIQRAEINKDLRSELVRRFTPEIHELEKVIGRNLSYWLL